MRSLLEAGKELQRAIQVRSRRLLSAEHELTPPLHFYRRAREALDVYKKDAPLPNVAPSSPTSTMASTQLSYALTYHLVNGEYYILLVIAMRLTSILLQSSSSSDQAVRHHALICPGGAR